MMFYEAAGGYRYAEGAYHRYQSFVDLSRSLQYEDQAILLVRTPAAGSQWLDGEQPLRSNQDRRWTYYRYLLPVKIN